MAASNRAIRRGQPRRARRLSFSPVKELFGLLERAVGSALRAVDAFLGSLNWTAVAAVLGLGLLVTGIWLDAGLPRALEAAGGLLLGSAIVDALLSVLRGRT